MKNIQSMSVRVNSTDSIMLKMLPAISLQETNHFSTDTIEDDDGDSFRLHLSENENSNDTVSSRKSDVIISMDSVQDMEEDMLNKYDVDSATYENVGNKLKYQLLNGLDDREVEKANSETIKSESEADIGVDKDDEMRILTNKTGNDITNVSDSVVNGMYEAINKEEEEEEESKTSITDRSEKASDEIIKDQIMDTEDLLEIVDKDGDDINDKDSCNGNSPRSIYKGESEDNDADMEIEKMGEDVDPNKTFCKDEDVDIEEEGPFKSEFDSELDREYEKMARSIDSENKVKSDATDGSDACKSEENNSISNAIGDKNSLEVGDKDIELGNDNLEDPLKESGSADVTKNVQDETATDGVSSLKSTKRTLSNLEELSNAKKLKVNQNETPARIADKQPTIQNEIYNNSNNIVSIPKLITLNAVSDYMRSKSLMKLSRNDLEQICLLKMCEAICHRSEIGELRHQLGVQEQMMDMWRKEALQLTKQARDLEIVNKRLLHEVRLKNERDKPLIPVKITRSVGLQVRSDSNVINNMMGIKRRLIKPQIPTTSQSTVVTPPKQSKFAPQRPNIVNKSITPTNKVPVSNKVTIPLINRGTPTVNKGISPINKGTPTVNKGTLPMNKTAPIVSKTTPIVNKTTPIVNKTTPIVNKTTPIVNKTTPIANKTTPIVNKTLPTVNKGTPTANKGTPAANKGTPAANKGTPAANKGTPAANKGTPAANKGTPIVNKGTTTPIVNKSVSTPANKGVSVIQRKALQNSTSSPLISSTPVVFASTNQTTSTTTSSTTNMNKNQNNAVTRPALKTTSPKTVIDLTDDDDKKIATTVAVTSTASPSTQSVRMVSNPIKTTAATIVQSNSNPTRIMYLYNSDQPKNGPQKLMLLNTSQANSIIASVSNGSPVTVTSGSLRTNLTTPVKIATPATMIKSATTVTTPKSLSPLKHPAPLPPAPQSQLCISARLPIPPKPHLSIRRSENGIVLSWKMPYNLDSYEPIASYQLYAYQEIPAPPASELWRKVGDVKALALPMACTLTQFADGNKYYFAVRAVDVQKRMGPFSDPQEIHL